MMRRQSSHEISFSPIFMEREAEKYFDGITGSESQVPIHVEYYGNVVGEFVADILVEDVVIIELKSVKRICLP